MESILDLTDKILSLTVAHPKSCQHSARRMIATRDGMKKIAVFCDSIGMEYARQLFDRITSTQWRMIQDIVRSLSNEPETQSAAEMSRAQILLEVYTEFLIETMSTET